jgi:carbon-monoxide dehydrogenase medium subunit
MDAMDGTALASLPTCQPAPDLATCHAHGSAGHPPRDRSNLSTRITINQGQRVLMRYEAPDSLDKAAALLSSAKGDAHVLAGGTDLLVQLRSDILAPDLIVDIKNCTETRTISEEKGGFRVGAAVTGAELKEHAKLKKAWPGVVEAANLIGSTQVQGRASMGGNLCNGSPAADSVPALIAAKAVATVVGPKGRRDIPVEDVMIGVRKLSLQKGEVLASFLLPARGKGQSDAYLRFIPRTEMDIAVVGTGVSLTLDGSGKITDARLGLGAVAEKVLLVPDAAKAIIGSTLDDAAQKRLEAAVRAACRPIDDKRGTKEFRIDIAGVLARRTALIAYERAKKA